jgi:hypothetical protein
MTQVAPDRSVSLGSSAEQKQLHRAECLPSRHKLDPVGAKNSLAQRHILLLANGFLLYSSAICLFAHSSFWLLLAYVLVFLGEMDHRRPCKESLKLQFPKAQWLCPKGIPNPKQKLQH